MQPLADLNLESEEIMAVFGGQRTHRHDVAGHIAAIAQVASDCDKYVYEAGCADACNNHGSCSEVRVILDLVQDRKHLSKC